tara:strand:- start:952 stop:1248 length:297 start_codon:yes stop_codon:yes gene_type:complete
METQKSKVITEFVKISQELQQQIKLEYPEGFVDELIQFPYKGEIISALRFETDEKGYRLKMTIMMMMMAHRRMMSDRTSKKNMEIMMWSVTTHYCLSI